MRRSLVLLALASLACSSGSGPTEPQAQSVSGVYSGTNVVVTNTCSGETGELLGVRSISITQTGSSIRIILAGATLNGTIQSNGAFTASGSEVIDGVTIQITMEGSITGNRLLATDTAVLSVPGDSCTIVISFNMTREP